jgi:hypothetical protein
MRYILCLLLLAMSAHVFAVPALVWVEGENPTSTKAIVANAGFNEINPYALSGGAWLSSFSLPGSSDIGTAQYDVALPAAGAYQLWLRAAVGTGIDCQIDSNNALSVDMRSGTDARPAAADGNVGWPPRLEWFKLDAGTLPAGAHTVRFVLGGSKPGSNHFAAIDCFVLTTGDFAPNGKYKPGEDTPKPFADISPDNAWDFNPPADALDPSAMLDLRSLNETTAGQHGFIGLSKDGNSFVTTGNGQPIRFWGCTETNQDDMTMAELEQRAKFLAKRGVNIVRVHTILAPKDPNSQVTDVNEEALDRIFKLVAAMKTAGIYTIISPYWGTATVIQKNWGALGDTGKRAEPLLFIDPALEKGYKSWLTALYTRPNPYTGVKLADDPSVAIIQLQNENSLLFFTLKSMNDAAILRFRTLYAQFLTKKYGSLDKARTAWHDYNPGAKDMWITPDWDKGLPPILDPWDFTRDGLALKGKWPGYIECSADQLQFMATTEYDFNARIVKFLRQDLGCKQLVNPGNWKGVDPETEQDAEYWSYTAGDVIGRNFYADGFHQGVNAGWQLLAGDFYTDPSMTETPLKLPINLKQPLGHPFIVPETLWVEPTLYESEGPAMMAAQTALNGIDTVFWFADGEKGWQHSASAMWDVATPMTLGQFPAAAMIFREGLVAQGAPAVVEQRSMQDVWDRKTPLLSEEGSYDPNRDQSNIPLTSSVKTTVDPLAFLVGPVQTVLGGDPAKSKVVDLSKYIDRDKKVVHSVTGEITTDYGRGVYLINAPRAQGAVGFLGAAGLQALSDVTVSCKNKYASILAVAMDGKSLKQSGKVLLQAGTVWRPTGWESVADKLLIDKQPFDCFKIVSTGSSPFQVEKTDAVVTVANPRLAKAQALDVNGMPIAEAVAIHVKNGVAVVNLPPDALYTVLTSQ